jgi:hypothetical protein
VRPSFVCFRVSGPTQDKESPQYHIYVASSLSCRTVEVVQVLESIRGRGKVQGVWHTEETYIMLLPVHSLEQLIGILEASIVPYWPRDPRVWYVAELRHE